MPISNVLEPYQSLLGPNAHFNNTVFVKLPMQDWAKALINPWSLLGVPKEKTLEFQLAALISMDYIWMARKKFINGGSRPNPMS